MSLTRAIKLNSALSCPSLPALSLGTVKTLRGTFGVKRNKGLRLEYVAHMSLVRASAGRGRLLLVEAPAPGLRTAAVPRLLPPPLPVLVLFREAGDWDPRPAASSGGFSCRSSVLQEWKAKACRVALGPEGPREPGPREGGRLAP